MSRNSPSTRDNRVIEPTERVDLISTLMSGVITVSSRGYKSGEF
jgi:hypothetical protein